MSEVELFTREIVRLKEGWRRVEQLELENARLTRQLADAQIALDRERSAATRESSRTDGPF